MKEAIEKIIENVLCPPRKEKPTIAELENILDSKTGVALVIKPDGSLKTASSVKISEIAQAIVDRIGLDYDVFIQAVSDALPNHTLIATSNSHIASHILSIVKEIKKKEKELIVIKEG